MTRARIVLELLAVAAVLALALPGAAAGAPPPSPPDPTCSPGPSSCYAWHTSDVTVSWAAPPGGVTATGCGSVKITSDTGGTSVSCTWSNAEGSRTTTANVRRDSSPPSVSAKPERGPDVNGWYTRPVGVSFSGSDPTSGVSNCTSGTYGGPDTGGTAVSGTCSNGAGLTGGASYELKYDATAPTVVAKPERQPDADGWYNRPFTVTFEGADAVSGVESCTAPVAYNGPETAKASLAGTCKDHAANTSAATAFEFGYDTRPPTLKRVAAEVRRNAVIVRWTASKDAQTFTVQRRPGLRGAKPSVLYSGSKRAFTDRRAKRGVRYRYTVTAFDQAANAAAKGLVARAGTTGTTTAKATKAGKTAKTSSAARKAVTGLVQPAKSARVEAAPLLLRWRPVPKATYYNVQLYRAGTKVLTSWTTGLKLRVGRAWTYAGRKQVLRPGRYRWYVWPGFGRPKEARFGKLIGTRSFVVVP